MGEAPKPLMMVAIDDSGHSYHALEWALEHFFTAPAPHHPFRLMLIHARPPPPSLLNLAEAESPQVATLVENDLKKIAEKVVKTGKEICSKKSVKDVPVEVMKGDPRNVMVDAVEKFQPAMLVMGSHGYGAVKRAVLGSVSDYCAHHCACTVMIVKRHKSSSPRKH